LTLSPVRDTPAIKPSAVKKRFLRGLGSTALGPVVTAIIQLGTVPLLLHAWGVGKYGDWLMLSAIPNYLNLANLGFGDASGSDMTVRVARGDRQGALETFQSSWVLLLLVSAAVLLTVSSLVWWIPWRHWMHLSSLSDRQAAETMLVLGTYSLIGQQCGIIESGYRCDGYFAMGTFWSTILRLVETVLATITGIVTGSLVSVALTYLVARGLGTLGYGLLLRQKSPWLSLGLAHARPERIRQLAAPALGFMALPLGNAISIQGFTLLIGFMNGPVAVTAFTTLRTLARVNFQLTTVLAWAVFPELSTAFGAGNLPLARTLHRRAYQASVALSLLTGAFLWFVGPWIYRSWIRHAVSFDANCFHILLLVTFANSLWFTSSVVAMSTNAHHRLTIAFMAASLGSLATGWLLIPLLGITGVAWALFMIDGLMVSLVLRTSLRQLHESFADFASALFTLPSGRSLAGLMEEA
jgi:O-antigen/teichoic acid export membrane protein